MLLAAVVSALLYVMFSENSGYKWVWYDLIGENLKFIQRNRHLNMDQRYQAKLGVDAAVLAYIRQNTPADAVILLPPGQVLLADSASVQFMKGVGGIKYRNWALNFLYPRKVVMAEERENSPWKSDITHVMLMDGWGNDFAAIDKPVLKGIEIAAFKKI